MAPIFTGSRFGFGRSAAGPTGPTVFIEYSATGGTTYTPGNGYKYHMFTFPNSSNFVVSGSESKNVEYLVVAGGGSGGWDRGGGGGAGGLRCNSPNCPAPLRGATFTVSSGTYAVTVGAGGAVAVNDSPYGNPGNPSSFGPITATGGGSDDILDKSKRSGGSGAGAHSADGGPYGLGNSPATSPPQGNNGGTSPTGGNPHTSSGGGGGAGGVGSNGGTSGSNGGPGGAALAVPDFAAPLFPGRPSPWISAVGPTGTYAGGGGGGGHQDLGWVGAGGTGGGAGAGNGGTGGGGAGGNAVNDTGSGGGGGNNIPQGNGGSGGNGVVIIRYLV